MKSISPAWKQALLRVLLIGGLLFALFGESARDMFLIWMRSETFAHAFIVPPISLWLIWRRRDALMQQEPKAWLPGVPGLLLLGLLWLAAWLGSANVVMQSCFVAMLVLGVVTALGLAASRVIAFALGFLFFAVPAGEFIVPALMSSTADFTVLALRWTGIPVYREGLSFVIPSGSWSVVEACSGIRYLIASVMVGTLFAYLNFKATKRRLVFIAVATALPLVANWLRAYMVVMIGHLSDNRLAAGVDHIIYGWVFFGVIMLGMFSVGARFADPVEAEGPRPEWPSFASQGASKGWMLALFVLMLGWGGTRAWIHQIDQRPASAAELRLALPEQLAQGWQAGELLHGWVPEADSANAEQARCYVKQGEQVCLYVAYYRDQSSQRKLIGSQSIVPGGGEHSAWTLLHAYETQLALPSATIGLDLREIRGSRDWAALEQPRLLVAQQFWVNGRWTNSELRGKVYAALDRLVARGDDTALVLVYTPLRQGHAGIQTLQQFLGDNLDALDQQLSALRPAAAASR